MSETLPDLWFHVCGPHKLWIRHNTSASQIPTSGNHCHESSEMKTDGNYIIRDKRITYRALMDLTLSCIILLHTILIWGLVLKEWVTCVYIQHISWLVIQMHTRDSYRLSEISWVHFRKIVFYCLTKSNNSWFTYFSNRKCVVNTLCGDTIYSLVIPTLMIKKSCLIMWSH